MTDAASSIGYALIQAALTIAFLVFAFAVRNDSPEMGGLVMGAAIGHWLGESVHMGRARAHRAHQANDDDGPG